MQHKSALIAVLLLPALAGCSADPTMMSGSSPPVARVTVAPNDGATGVRLDAPVTLSFRQSVDRSVVERSFHLLSEYDMLDAACPDSMMSMHGSMLDVMADSTMMRHMEASHATSGGFSWNEAGTACVFTPASWLRPQTRYMIHMGSEMMQMMGSMTGMGGHGTGTMAGDMMLHFTTMDTTSGGGHDGHH